MNRMQCKVSDKGLSEMQDIAVLTSKITIPTLGVDIVARPSLNERLQKMPEYSLTMIIAGAGYGKTTALAQYLLTHNSPVSWYNPGPEDDNVYSFSTYLAGALNSLIPGLKEWYFQKAAAEEKFDWKIAFSVLMAGIEFLGGAGPTGILVIDDWHYVQNDMEIRLFFDRFLACRPPSIHLVIMSREHISLPEIERIRARGQALDFTDKDLTFDLEEIEELLCKVKGSHISKLQVGKIFGYTEGWIIAIKLLVSRWQGNLECFSDNRDVETSDLEGLFEYLAQDVLERQAPDLQQFLLQSALVESFTISYCKEIFGSEFSTHLLNLALKKGLFIYRIGQGTYRYHALFREFLCREAELRLPDLTALYSKIGYYYWKRENAERTLHFLILGEQWESAKKLICEVGRHWVSSGRDKLLHNYLEQLPNEYRQHPEIYLALGDAMRFSCYYNQAIDWYKRAGQYFQKKCDHVGWSQSCRGIGEAYLDIIQPIHAQSYLKQAYKGLQEGQREDKAALLGLMAENMINQGNSRRAERYRQLMVGMLPFTAEDKNNLQVRIFLRTGRLLEVIEILERRYAQERTTYHVPRSFRESPLVLSLCYAYVGQEDCALKLAQLGIESAEKLRSPFVAAVGYIRQGHALLLNYQQNRELCQASYEKALYLAESLGILRGQTEVYQGRSLMHALDGDWQLAKRVGLEGIKITEKVHDEWFTAILYHTLGMGAALCGLFGEAKQFQVKALHLFERCRDKFGQTVCYWWLTFQAYQVKDKIVFESTYSKLMQYCKLYGYEFILERPSLLGDISGFSSQPFRRWAEELNQLGSEEPMKLPSQIPLVIQTLGPLKVWLYGKEVSSQEWRRAGAKQLLCLLLTLKMSMTNKEKLMFYLWPEANGEVTARNFKVVLNHLSNVLDPGRQLRTPCRFISRQGANYQIVLSEECQLDVQEFEILLDEGSRLLFSQPKLAKQSLLRAMALYQGEYLEGENLDELSLKERDRLEALAIRGGELLATLCMEQESYEEAINWTERILRLDSCWEKAYQILLISYGRLGNGVMLARTYKRCLSLLKEELGVKPSQVTYQIYEQYSK